jgi:hypothetical protein
MYLSNKEITAYLRHAAWSLSYFPQDAIEFVIYLFLIQIIMFLVYHPLELKYQASSYEVNNLLLCICLWNILCALHFVTNCPVNNESSTSWFHFACTFAYSL